MTGLMLCGVCGWSFTGRPSPELSAEVRDHMRRAHGLDLPEEHYAPMASPETLRRMVEQEQRRRARAAWN